MGCNSSKRKREDDHDHDHDDHDECPVTTRVIGNGSLRKVVRERNGAEMDERSLPVSSVIVTLRSSSSYDDMFTSIPQEGPPGERVSVFQASYGVQAKIAKALKGDEIDAEVKSLMEDINACETPDCVVFNWECCGGCSDQGFASAHERHSEATMELIEAVISRGSMVMCSDFSLKALIADWKTDLLGPNPFVQLGEFSSSFKLNFVPQTLIDGPSEQLRGVGELCGDKGHATVSAMPSTIAYTVDMEKASTPAYKLEVLSVATDMGGFNSEKGQLLCPDGSTPGAAGHVLLTYPTGGTLLTSCGHWVELVKLDVSKANLIKLAEKEYGAQFNESLNADLAGCKSDLELSSKMESWSKRMVMSRAPCRSSGWHTKNCDYDSD